MNYNRYFLPSFSGFVTLLAHRHHCHPHYLSLGIP
jgi:hypothetical protein